MWRNRFLLYIQADFSPASVYDHESIQQRSEINNALSVFLLIGLAQKWNNIRLAFLRQDYMKTSLFDKNLSSILSFISVFLSACNSNGIMQGASIHFSHYFMTNTIAMELSSQLPLALARSVGIANGASEQSGSYVKFLSYLLATYAAGDVISDPVEEIFSVRQGLGTKCSWFCAHMKWKGSLT